MLLLKEIEKLLNQFNAKTTAISIGGYPVLAFFDHNEGKVSLSSIVYDGVNFIPKSVRSSLTNKIPFNPKNLKTYFLVDERNFQISLNYRGIFENHDTEILRLLLEDFGTLSNEWRSYLDEHDKHDLLHVRVR